MDQVETTSLFTKKIVITRPENLAAEFSQKLKKLGAYTFEFPTIKIIPVDNNSEIDNIIQKIKYYDMVIFTSVNGVNYFINRLIELNLNPLESFNQIKLVAIGPATAKELKKHHLQTNFIPSTYIAESIASEIGNVIDKKILLPRADIARVDLKILLEQKGAIVTEVSAYRTIDRNPSEKEINNLIDFYPHILTFTSSSTVKGFYNAVKNTNFEVKKCIVACIGPVTAETALEYFGKVDVIGSPYTVDGLITSLMDYMNYNN